MYLLIDNSLNDKIILHCCLNTDWVQCEFDRDERSLLEIVEQLLLSKNKKLSDLQGLATIVGKGKFTATRIATTLANTLSFALKIPVLAVEDFYPNIIKDIQASPVGQYVSAQYSAPANIGGVKQ
jgi:tRNA A37 threonylcarbamoyladenosine modification protein TsaB